MLYKRFRTSRVAVSKRNHQEVEWPTLRNRLYTPSPRKLFCSKDANEYAQSEHAEPPADKIADKVDLLSRLASASPERDSREKERPADGTRGVRVTVRQARIVLYHEKLQFEEFSEEVHMLDLFWLGWRGPSQVGGIYKAGSVYQPQARVIDAH